jgi:hypothetical protein
VGVMTVGKELARCKLEVLRLKVVRCGVHVTLSYCDKNLTVMHLRNLEQRVVRD